MGLAEWLFLVESQADINDVIATVAWHNMPHKSNETVPAMPSRRPFPFTPIEQSHIHPREGSVRDFIFRVTRDRVADGDDVEMLQWGSALIYGGAFTFELRLYLRFFNWENANSTTMFIENYCPVLRIFYPLEKPQWYASEHREKYVSYPAAEPIVPPFAELVLRVLSTLSS